MRADFSCEKVYGTFNSLQEAISNFSASQFPKSLFTGIDFSLSAVVGANKRREEANEGLENLSFLQMDAQKLKSSWTEKFDWVTIFNACHDQTRPDLVSF